MIERMVAQHVRRAMRFDVSLSVVLSAGALVGGAGAQPAPALFPITVDDKPGMIHRDAASDRLGQRVATASS